MGGVAGGTMDGVGKQVPVEWVGPAGGGITVSGHVYTTAAPPARLAQLTPIIGLPRTAAETRPVPPPTFLSNMCKKKNMCSLKSSISFVRQERSAD